MTTRTPYTHRPLKNLYVSIYPLIVDDRYIDMKKDEFIKEAIKRSNGSIEPSHLETIYNSLMSDAGLGPKL